MTIEVKSSNDDQPKTVTSDSLAIFMNKTGFTFRQMEWIQSFFRKSTAFESCSNEKLVATTHKMDDFFEAKDQEFVEKVNKIEQPVTR